MLQLQLGLSYIILYRAYNSEHFELLYTLVKNDNKMMYETWQCILLAQVDGWMVMECFRHTASNGYELRTSTCLFGTHGVVCKKAETTLERALH